MRGIRFQTKSIRSVISAVIFTATVSSSLTACAQDTDVSENDQTRVKSQVSETPVIHTVTSSGETGASVEQENETISSDVGFSQIQRIIGDTLEGREQQKWSYFFNKFQKNDSIVGVDNEGFVELVLANEGQIFFLLTTIEDIKLDFPNLYSLIVEAKSEMLDKEGEMLDKEGEMLDKKGEMLDKKGEIIDVAGDILRKMQNKLN